MGRPANNGGKMSYYMRKKLEREAQAQAVPEVILPEAEVRRNQHERFGALNTICKQTIDGRNKAMIVSGPPGLGKSHTVLTELQKFEEKGGTFVVAKGFVRPTGLYKLLYEFRFPHCVIVFDDADSAFQDPVSLNILKAACEIAPKRRISWLTETKMLDEEGDRLPRRFEFEGNIIFITNFDFQAMIDKGHPLSPHFEALVSRSLYIDLGLKTRRDNLIRIKDVIAQGMLKDRGIDERGASEIISFIEEHSEALRELSLRLVVKIAMIKRNSPTEWKTLAKVTCCR